MSTHSDNSKKRVVFRDKSTHFMTTKKFGEGHIPEEASKVVGPASYNARRVEKSYKVVSKDIEMFKTLQIADSIRRMKRIKDSQKPKPPKTIDLNDLTMRMGCKKRQVPKCNMARAPRFPKSEYDEKPGPGTYGKFLDKHQEKKYFRRCYQDFNVAMNIDRSTCLKTHSDLAPGMYNIKEQTCNGVSNVSVMSGSMRKRDIWADLRDYLQSPGQYNLKSGLDELAKNKYVGCFMKAPRFPNKHFERIMLNDLGHAPREPDEPSPAHYKPNYATCRQDRIKLDGDSEVVKPAFNSTSRRDSAFVSKSIEKQFRPGPGRYYPTPLKNTGDTYQSVFLSKGRIQTNKQFMSFKERIKSSHIRNIPECRVEGGCSNFCME